MPNVQLRAITRGVPYDGRKSLKELEKQLRAIQEGARYELKKSTERWKVKPTFYVRRFTSGDSFGLDAGTDSELWGMLDQGTEPHTIEAHGQALRFMPGASSGFATGDPLYRQRVSHPGTQAKNWTLLVADKVRARYSMLMQEAIDIWVEITHEGVPRE